MTIWGCENGDHVKWVDFSPLMANLGPLGQDNRVDLADLTVVTTILAPLVRKVRDKQITTQIPPTDHLPSAGGADANDDIRELPLCINP